ncbi:MAG: RHS repeat-associated core domain-containing protein, partial [Mediterranea massiliensis]|nr:RHS repeat-associated core domain-containing protein [Mediterranea massiliensis]
MKRLYILMMMLLGSLLTAYAQTSTQNYVRTKRYMDNSSYMESIDYYDGLGRIAQENSRGITPGGNDLVTLHEYDGFGRESKVWLPTPSSANGAWVDVTTLKNGAISAYNDDLPYGSFVYEQSPQNRVVKEFKAGEAWSEHPKTIYYDNSYGYWVESPSQLSSLLPIAQDDGYLLCGSAGVSALYLIQYTDEDGKVSLEFYDKKGRLRTTRQIDGNTQHSTCYVYDHIGQLRYILPPLATDGIHGIYDVVSDTLSCLQKYAYIYRYDKRGNLKYKKLPGCEPIYYVYDKGDRLIFTQNGEQRSRGEWSFTFPDAFGRVVLEGTCSVSLNYNNNPLTETVVNATRTNATDANKGYSISGISVTNMQIHRVNYYDNYAFIGQNSVPTTLSYSTPDTGYGTRYENHYKGLLTGSIIARWENGAVSGYDYAAYYYDQQGNVVQEKRTNHLGGLETNQYVYDRLGNPLKKKHVHTASGKTTRTEELTYTYDSGARPTKVVYKLSNGTTTINVPLADYSYDEFCRLSSR